MLEVSYDGATAVCGNVKDCSAVYSKYQLLVLGLVVTTANATLTPASTMMLSSQPKFEMTNVRVHALSSIKIHARIRKAIVILYACIIAGGTWPTLYAPMLPLPALWDRDERHVGMLGGLDSEVVSLCGEEGVNGS